MYLVHTQYLHCTSIARMLQIILNVYCFEACQISRMPSLGAMAAVALTISTCISALPSAGSQPPQVLRLLLRILAAAGAAVGAAQESEAPLTAKEMQRLHKHFDIDRDGKASSAEILQFSVSLREKVARKDVGLILEALDTSKDQKVSLEEHMADWSKEPGWENNNNFNTVKEVETQKFYAADSDGDRLLNSEELLSLFYPGMHNAVLRIATAGTLKQRDNDDDGKLTEREFWLDGNDDDIQTSEEEKSDFERLDKNRDGFLDVDELLVWESGEFSTELSLAQLFKTADADEDGHVTAAELEAARNNIVATDI